MPRTRTQNHVSRRPATLLTLTVAALTLASCGGYTLRGRVIDGDISYATVVGANDERLSMPGVGGVTVTLETDPGRVKREFIGEAVSNPDGEFEIRVRKPGAGFLMYDAGIEARRRGYEGVRHMFPLPSSSKRLLIMLRPGNDTLPEREGTLMEQYEQFRNR